MRIFQKVYTAFKRLSILKRNWIPGRKKMLIYSGNHTLFSCEKSAISVLLCLNCFKVNKTKLCWYLLYCVLIQLKTSKAAPALLRSALLSSSLFSILINSFNLVDPNGFFWEQGKVQRLFWFCKLLLKGTVPDGRPVDWSAAGEIGINTNSA